MSLVNEINLEEIRQDLYHLIQTNDDSRLLDSLETIVVRSSLEGRGINLAEIQGPKNNTIGGWISWLRQFLKDG